MLKKINEIFMHQGFKKYFFNTSWFFFEKILKIILGLFVTVYVARYLGANNFGILSYVGSVITILSPLGRLGLDGILHREIVKNETDITVLLNSAFFLRIIGSIFILLISNIYLYIQGKEKIYIYINLIFGFIYLFKAFEVIEFYFRAKVKAIYISISHSIAIIISSLLKFFFVFFKVSLIFFAFANLLEVFISVIYIIFFFRKEPHNINIRSISVKKSIDLLKESWPLIFSSIFALVYLNIDQVMIGDILDSSEVGLYSIAVRISSAFYFIPMTIGWSLQTAIINAKKKNEKLYYKRLQQLFTLSVILAYIIVFIINFFSSNIIIFLFGNNYYGAISVLHIHIWASLFLFSNVARGIWLLNEGLLKFDLYSNIIAGFLNIFLNYIWLTKYGIIGAAWATLISYSFTYFFSGLFFKPMRKIFFMQLKAILLIDMLKQTKKIIGDTLR